jgi:hypothetical protein
VEYRIAADNSDAQAERTSGLSISRLYTNKKNSPRQTDPDGSPRDRKDKTKVSPTSKKNKPKDVNKQTEENDAAVLRKRTSPTPASALPIRDSVDGGMEPLEPGQSIIVQVGEPDHCGWMRKKGDRYNHWKLRYFILKGPHMYCLRSNHRTVCIPRLVLVKIVQL